jgi:hypothetical protein
MDRSRDEIDDPLGLDRFELIKLEHHRSLLAQGQSDGAGIAKAPAVEHLHLLKAMGIAEVHAASMTALAWLSSASL